MKQEQFFNAVLMSLNVDYLNTESDFELMVNSAISLAEKTEKTKEFLTKLVEIENNINKFKALFVKEEDQKPEEK